jgi:hypothetical protein
MHNVAKVAENLEVLDVVVHFFQTGRAEMDIFKVQETNGAQPGRGSSIMPFPSSERKFGVIQILNLVVTGSD